MERTAALNILLPTDFSKNSKVAIAYAVKLYKGVAANFYLLHSYHLPHSGASILVSIEDIIKQDAEDELAALKEEILGLLNPEDKVETFLEKGDLYYAIESMRRNHRIDAIVMGTKGASGVKEKLVGSNAFKVLRDCPVPVWIIPEHAEIKQPSKIGLASDLVKVEEKVFEPIHTLKQWFPIDVLAVHVQSMDTEKQKVHVGSASMPDFIEEMEFVSGDDIQRSLWEWAKVEQVDVMAVIRHKQSLIDRILGKSDTRKLVMSPEIPMLILQG